MQHEAKKQKKQNVKKRKEEIEETVIRNAIAFQKNNKEGFFRGNVKAFF